MSLLFGRTGALTLGTKQIKFAAAGKPTLAVEFHVKKSLKPEPNTVEIKVWNLAPETRKALETPKLIPVQLDVGYGGDNHTIYVGDLRSAESTIEGPNIITTISSGDKEQALSSARMPATQIPKKMGAKEILVAVAKGLTKAGVGLGNIAQASASATTGGPATTFHGNAAAAFDQAARASGQEWSVQDGALQVMPIGATVGNGRAVLLSAATGLVGSPSQDTKGVVTARALIQPGLFPGMPVEIKGVLLQGTYRIEVAEFSGATWGPDWTVTIHAKKWG